MGAARGDAGENRAADDRAGPRGPRRRPRPGRGLTLSLVNPEPVVLSEVPVAIDPAEARAFVTYRALPWSPAVEARLDAAQAEVEAVMRPRLACRTLAVVEPAPDALTLEDGTRLHIPHIRGHWGAVDRVVAGLVTIGGEVDGRIERRRETDALGAALLDCAASAAVECLAEWTNDVLCQQGVEEARRVTNRISPGLAGWALAEQVLLLSLLPLDALGVGLRPDGTMTPAKTISLLVGVGATARIDHYFVQCRRCWASACPARRMAAIGSVHASADA